MTSVPGAGLGRYLKEAFLFRWNLLLFLGGAAAAAIGPFPDVFLPLVGALELVYLGGLTSIPRFRDAIDARARAGPSGAPEAATALADLVDALEAPSRARFERLRARCLEMQRLARGMRGQGSADAKSADPIRTPALDRLLWAFLRLLGAQQALQRFLAAADQAGLQRSLQDLRAKREKAEARKDERLTRALADAIATGEQRLANYGKAGSNAEFLSVELDRIEGKIQALAEMAVSHQDADQISSQVDAVAASMAHTEQAIREIDQITGLGDQLAEPPRILEAGVQREGS